jgi:hypothetical protein
MINDKETIQILAEEWLAAKEAERLAVERRRMLEDQMRELAAIADDADGVQNLDAGYLKIKVTCRLDRKVDSDKLQDLAIEAGLVDHMSTLFRWKPEVNPRAWEACDPAITTALAGAITTKPGRPSFAIQTTKE